MRNKHNNNPPTLSYRQNCGSLTASGFSDLLLRLTLIIKKSSEKSVKFTPKKPIVLRYLQ